MVYFHRNGWYTFTETGGILSPKRVVYFHRNGWYTFAETGGILSPKYPKKALKAKKAQGHKLGKPENFTDVMRKKGRAAHHDKAIEDEHNKRAYAMITALRQQHYTYRQIASKLNDAGFKSSRGNSFHAHSIWQIEKMYTKSTKPIESPLPASLTGS